MADCHNPTCFAAFMNNFNVYKNWKVIVYSSLLMSNLIGTYTKK